MILQHVLTADLFTSIFDEPQFHRENNIAKELETVVATFLSGDTRRQLMGSIRHYYEAIKAAAARINDHREKQNFLKVVYESFYKSYNPKAADTLGVVYTPSEVVDFMIQTTDALLDKHFHKLLHDPDVHILDPATGTGTFVCDLLNYLPLERLEYKYKNKLFANELAILPYYIANLNIEFTYRQRTQQYTEFPNLCFMDTLDNYSFGTEEQGVQGVQKTMEFTMSKENTERIERQNRKIISVIIGNPPYNANQANENDNNKNRAYTEVDKKIKDTFIYKSNAQKTKLYDMYTRFYRWAFDRIENQGIIAFITNRSFIDSRSFDGFRLVAAQEFDYLYIIDTHSDVRANPKISGTKNNVFGIQTGVAVMFLVKMDREEERRAHDAANTGKPFHRHARIKYKEMKDEDTRVEKLQWFAHNRFRDVVFKDLFPDEKGYWFPTVGNDEWEAMIPVANPLVKKGKHKEDAIFQLYSLGVVTSRDDWVYDFDAKNLENKVKHFIDVYNQEVERWNINIKDDKANSKYQNIKLSDFVNREIKWTSELEANMAKGNLLSLQSDRISRSIYRPFMSKFIYFARVVIHRFYQFDFIPLESNILIAFSGTSSSKPFQCLSSNRLVGLDLLEKTQCLPLYRFDKEGRQRVNILDWAIQRFQNHYAEQKGADIGPEDVFSYVYAALHHPVWRVRFAEHLKRELPRIPFYGDFWAVAAIGKALIELHTGFESAEPWPLERQDYAPADHQPDRQPQALLKADKTAGVIQVDEHCSLRGIPKEAWEYKLGNRSALEWVLDQYKERKPRDPTVAKLFPPYRLADHKETVINLLRRVCRVSVETVLLLRQLEEQG